MSITIKDISTDELLLTGGLARRATLEEPEEYHEVSREIADGLGADKVWLVSDGKAFAYVTSDFDDAPKEAFQALIKGPDVTTAQLAEITEWLEAEGRSDEHSVFNSIAEKAQENLENE